ncbi:hypothetical protein [Arachidicoccus soli]|uniref:Uncharacterized protein n=1 Tax=Arachidicoccus soli TaxID=2341117 RepID=A0A386HSV7_9BACT|nr:hypothetical protein [Arachidicoccus soli]AYD48782.1 hypothetical protein D6B99_14910 [Arachidicoccus soli]
MARIYIIAGIPGIGKSTSGRFFVPQELNILDSDLMAAKYKADGFLSYKEIGQIKFDRLFDDALMSEKDFGIELNLGFESHYHYVKRIKRFNAENEIIIVLFHTDDIELCKERAKIRIERGLHKVTPEVIDEMYKNLFSLFNKYIDRFTGLIAVNAEESGGTTICLEHNFKTKQTVPTLPLPDWIEREFSQLIKPQLLQIKRITPHVHPPIDKNKKRRGRGI